MRVIPAPEEVEPMLELGAVHVPQGDSEEWIRLQAVRASWPFAFPGLALSREQGIACERAGLEASEMAIRLGRYDLASAALDAAAGFGISLGLYNRVLPIEARRLELLPNVGDLLEIGDAYAMVAWSNHELGRYAAGLEKVEKGLALVEGRAANAEVHLRAWLSILRFRLGDWDGAIEAFEEIRRLLDERRDDPPYFATHTFAAAATIFDRRGDTVESDRMTGLLRPLAGGFSSRLLPWFAILLIERGELDPARRALAELPDAWRVHMADFLEARCELAAAEGSWDQVPELVGEIRAYAEESDAAAPPIFGLRLEGRAALAEGDSSRAEELLARATEGFRTLDAPYEVAVSSLDLGRACVASGRSADATLALDRANTTLERLNAVKAQAAVRDLRAQLER